MTPEALSSYLNDHLAGSVAALEMVDHLITVHDMTPRRPFFVALRTEIQTDQDTLKLVIAAAGLGESVTRQAVAWTMEKIAWLKLEASDLEGYGLLQALEGLVLGITGKRGLWEVLDALPSPPSALRDFHFATLMERAEAQIETVNRQRVAVAFNLFSTTGEVGVA